MRRALWLPQELKVHLQCILACFLRKYTVTHDEAWLARAAFNRLADAPQWALVEAAAVSEHKAAGRVLRFA